MKEWFYQIKGKDTGSGFGNWAWPPLFTGKVAAPDRSAAKVLIEEEYGRKFPTRVLAKDLDSNEFLLGLKEIKESDHYTRKLFEVQTCKNCQCQFSVIEKYSVNNPGGGSEFCSRDCSRAYDAAHGDYANSAAQGAHPPVIYRITYKPTGQCYIGKTTQAFTLRWWQHFFHGTNTKFHKAIRETSITDWTFEVIEMVEVPAGATGEERDAMILSRESFHIAAHKSAVHGFNTVGPGEQSADLFPAGEA